MELTTILSIALSLCYIGAAVGWFFLWNMCGGYSVLQEKKLLYIPYVLCPFTLCANAVLVHWERFPPYELERVIHEHLVSNARVIATLALAVGIFVRIGLKPKFFDQFLCFILLAFALAVAGVLPVYWQPAVRFTLTCLRHLKTIPYTYSIYLLTAALLCFMDEGATTPSGASDKKTGPAGTL